MPHAHSFCQRDGGKELGTPGEHSKRRELPPWGRCWLSVVGPRHGATWGKRHGRAMQASVPSAGRLTCRWDRA